MRKKVVKISLLLISLMLSILFPILAVTAKKEKLVLDPVYIDDLVPGYTWADWEAEPWLKGSGTFEDPYMIKKIVINGDGSTFCMAIWNSEAYFKIMDSIFYNTKPPEVDQPNAGISMVNTQNGVIFKNQIFDIGWMGAEVGSGIALINSDNNKIQKNILSDNEAVGIYLENSDNNVVVDNYVSGSLWGIMLWNIGTGSSDGNTITRNECIDNFETGIVVGWSYANTVTQNLCTGNIWGISILTWAGYNIVTQNDCKGNSESGIVISDNAFANEIKENDCSDNFQNGIFLVNNANNNLVTGNDCKKNLASGIAVLTSSGNIVTDNNCSGNGAVGIYLESSNYNFLERNDCRENGASGIMMLYSNENTINGNNCTRNSYGIYITGSYGNDVIENICSESYYEHGILIMDYAAYNTISRNICFKNARQGIVLYNYANNNIITENICYENFESGIVLDSSFQNTVENNLAYGNAYTGMQVYNAKNNMIVGNTFNENEVGIHVLSDYHPYMTSTGNKITNNDCKENLNYGINVVNSNGNIITNNNCSVNFGTGVLINSWWSYDAEDNILCGNIIENNLIGILLSNADNNDIFRNLVKENTIGIVLVGDSELNLIYHNNFIDNEVQAYTTYPGLNNWHNIYMLEGNYWSDYTGTDSDGDGIGDTEWPEIGYDAYPFMEQDGWDILTAQEEELLNAFFDPGSNRLAGYRTVRSDETCYIMIGLLQLFSERIERLFCPPFTAHFEFFGVVYPFQGSFWYFWEDVSAYGEPGYTQFFYIILPPYYFPYVGLPPGEYSFQWRFSFYMDGVYTEMALDRIFYLV